MGATATSTATGERFTSVPPRRKVRRYNPTLLSLLFEAQPSGRKQIDFARARGYHAVTVNAKLRGRDKADPETTRLLAEWFDLPEEAFFDDSDLDISILVRGNRVDSVAY